MFYLPILGAVFANNPIYFISPQVSLVEESELIREHNVSGIFYSSNTRISVTLHVYCDDYLARLAEQAGLTVVWPKMDSVEPDEPVKKKKKNKEIIEEMLEQHAESGPHSIEIPYIVHDLVNFNLPGEAQNITEHEKFQRLYARSERNQSALDEMLELYYANVATIRNGLAHQPEIDDDEEDGLTLPSLTPALMEAQRHGHQAAVDEARNEIEKTYVYLETKILGEAEESSIPFSDIEQYINDGKVEEKPFTTWYLDSIKSVFGV